MCLSGAYQVLLTREGSSPTSSPSPNPKGIWGGKLCFGACEKNINCLTSEPNGSEAANGGWMPPWLANEVRKKYDRSTCQEGILIKRNAESVKITSLILSF